MIENELKANKTILRLLFAGAALLLLCSALSGAAAAAGSWSGDVFTPDEDGYASAEAFAADINTGHEGTVIWSSSNPDEVILNADVKLGGSLMVTGAPAGHVTFDLNGHLLQAVTGDEKFPVVMIMPHESVTLTDRSSGVLHTFTFVSNGPWIPDSEPAAGAVPLAKFDRAAAEAAKEGTYHVSIPGGCITGGSGVFVEKGTFTMSGGSIAGNSAATFGGGVSVIGGGMFTMSGGSIAGNSTGGNGGGVYLMCDESASCRFVMSGGSIAGNSAGYSGGGVYAFMGGAFTMSGGSIAGNSAGDNGGGVCAAYEGVFTMKDGSIGENSAKKNGGGVFVDKNGVFMMDGGSIGENSTEYEGGGVCAAPYSMFTMSGGSIAGNSAGDNGGGVYAAFDGVFTMNGGSITGNSVTGVFSGNGGGVYVEAFDGGESVYRGTFEVSGAPVVRGNIKNGTVNNVYLEEDGKAKAAFILTGNLTGDIRITEVSGKVPQKGDVVGTAADGASGAKYITADGTKLFGCISGGKIVWAAPASKSSGSQGTSIWLTETPVPTPTETPVPTPTTQPTPEVPTVKPVTQQPTGAGASPAPLAGVLAGLGAAAAVFGLRRK